MHPKYKQLVALASKIEGLKRQSGIHAAGILIYDGKLDESTLKIIEGEIHGPRKILRKIRRTKRRTVY